MPAALARRKQRGVVASKHHSNSNQQPLNKSNPNKAEDDVDVNGTYYYYYWQRPLGATEGFRRLSVVSNTRRKVAAASTKPPKATTTTRSITPWSLPLQTWGELEEAIRQTILAQPQEPPARQNQQHQQQQVLTTLELEGMWWAVPFIDKLARLLRRGFPHLNKLVLLSGGGGGSNHEDDGSSQFLRTLFVNNTNPTKSSLRAQSTKSKPLQLQHIEFHNPGSLSCNILELLATDGASSTQIVGQANPSLANFPLQTIFWDGASLNAEDDDQTVDDEADTKLVEAWTRLVQSKQNTLQSIKFQRNWKRIFESKNAAAVDGGATSGKRNEDEAKEETQKDKFLSSLENCPCLEELDLAGWLSLDHNSGTFASSCKGRFSMLKFLVQVHWLRRVYQNHLVWYARSFSLALNQPSVTAQHEKEDRLHYIHHVACAALLVVETWYRDSLHDQKEGPARLQDSSTGILFGRFSSPRMIRPISHPQTIPLSRIQRTGLTLSELSEASEPSPSYYSDQGAGHQPRPITLGLWTSQQPQLAERSPRRTLAEWERSLAQRGSQDLAKRPPGTSYGSSGL